MSNLNQLSDTGLSAVFAVEVAGYLQHNQSGPNGRWVHNGVVWMCPSVLTFSTSMDAVLPYLERTLFRIERLCQPDEYCVYIELPAGTYVKGCDARLSKAACIALILAARAEKEAAK